jgi:hypothetical protein
MRTIIVRTFVAAALLGTGWAAANDLPPVIRYAVE